MHKLDIHNTAGMVKYAMERGWGNGMSTNGDQLKPARLDEQSMTPAQEFGS